ncbi:uncharacterized protein LOC134230870 [Saccostrea cucullata]|uniref:uncharacterized protein LOC134230870 n=1 Tax=Saccostrea cuccullata TaxID=36930 RepID=UPI002ED4BB83
MGVTYSVGPYICLFIVPVVTQETGQKWTEKELGRFNICPSDTYGILRCCYGFTRDEHGSCTVCPPGTFGANCESICPRGTYGTHCKLSCGDKCSECHQVYGCQENRTSFPGEKYMLTLHKHEYPTTWPVSAMIVVTALSTCLLMCLIIQSVVCCRKRKKKKRSENLTNTTKNTQYYGLKPNTGQIHMYAEQYNDVEESNSPSTQNATLSHRKYDYVDEHRVRKLESSTELRGKSKNGTKYYDSDGDNIRSKNKSSTRDLQYSLVNPGTSSQLYRQSNDQYLEGNGTEDYLDPVYAESIAYKV